jgi:hypothetical protein
MEEKQVTLLAFPTVARGAPPIVNACRFAALAPKPKNHAENTGYGQPRQHGGKHVLQTAPMQKKQRLPKEELKSKVGVVATSRPETESGTDLFCHGLCFLLLRCAD